jgi:hypothetical protein
MIDDAANGAVYVAIGGIAQSALRGYVSPVVVEDDNLLLGPSSAAPRRHRAVRKRYWGAQPSAKLNEELARSDGPPLCVVLPPTLRGLLSFGRICASCIERKRPVFAIALGPDIAVAPTRGYDPTEDIVFDVADALRQRPPVARCSSLETALVATVWKMWCRRSPVALSRFCASASSLHPQLANLGRYHAGWFPRQIGSNILLSRFDELLLRQLSNEWTTSSKVFLGAMSARSGLHEWLSHVGDLYVPKRLLEWCWHGQGRIVECQEHPEKPSELSRWSFRWRPGGEAILDALPSLRDAPPVAIGGAMAYDPDRCWVCRVGAGGTPFLSRLATASTGAQRV